MEPMQNVDGTRIVSLEEGWNGKIKAVVLDALEDILDTGFDKNTKLFSNSEYMSVYSTCYNMCTQKNPFNWSVQLYEKRGEALCNYLSRSVVPALKQVRGEQLLAEFVKRGENHKIMNMWHQRFFMYLDRFHVKYYQLPQLKDSGIRYYKSLVFDMTCTDVTESIITLVNAERQREMNIDRGQIRKCIEVYEMMGMGTLDTYTTDFEESFLTESRKYYKEKANLWASQDSTPAYLTKIEQAIDEEKQRVSHYLNKETEAKLLHVLETECLQAKETELIEKEGSGCKALLNNDSFADLARMYTLFSRITNGLVPIAKIFQQHILDMGTEKIGQRIARYSDDAEPSAKDKETNDDPEFIRDLLSIHDKYLKVVNEQFGSNALFQKALKDAFSELVNRDTGKFKTADLISTYCDRFLKSGSSEKLSEAEMEETLEKSVQLFSYLTEKDMFADSYRNQLARRLLQGRSASDEMERMVIGKLKMRCGSQFTAKMEGMLNDLSIGNEAAVVFEKYSKDNADKTGLGKMGFSVQVLTNGYWPSYKNVDMVLPLIMQKALQVYQTHYDGKASNSNRRLLWTLSQGNVQLKSTFAKGNVYEIKVVTLQAAVLLCFNEKESMLFSEIQEVLNINEDVLKRILHSLYNAGKFKNGNVLKRVTEAGNEKKPPQPTDTFEYNPNFFSKTKRFLIAMASLDDTNSVKRVEDDRSVAIEAAVVRIMKARKTLSHQQLLAETLSQLAFFKPTPREIKQRFEVLIDREYIERDPNDNQVYKYLA